MSQPTIGVDVSKDALDACRLPERRARRFANNQSGRAALLRWIGRDVACVVFEATGHYSKPLERALADSGLPAAKVNTKRARRFAEAVGKLAKTDRIDAETLAAMARQLDLEPSAPVGRVIEMLKELVLARRALVKDRTAALNRAKRLVLPVLVTQNQERLAQIGRDIEAIDGEIEALLEADPQLRRRAEILESIPGLGHASAVAILAEMPELGALEPKAAAALAGLAPQTRQSGTWKGRARIQGGRAEARRALYMPALVAARFNPDLKRVYDRLVDAGKPAKVAITALMRKLVVLANALLRQNRFWTPAVA